MFKNSFYNFLFSFFTVLITASFCSFFNRIGMQNFYGSLNLSELNPPNYVFPLVWLLLYVLLILSFDRILNQKNRKEDIKTATQLFMLNMFLQVIWTFVFFANAYFLVAFVVLIVLVFATIYLMEQFYKIDKTAAYLLIPYFLWLLFAAYLNWAVVDLNGPSLIVAF